MSLDPSFPFVTAGAALVAAAWGLPRAWQRIELSRAKHRSLAGHGRIASRIAKLLPGYAYDEAQWFDCDGAPGEVVARRRAGFARLCADLGPAAHGRTLALTQQARKRIADLQFTGSYRVPFQFSPYLRQHLAVGAFYEASSGVKLRDLDGREFYDVAGSYGVNLLGYDVYKQCIDEAVRDAGALGPLLGSYHPLVADNVERLAAISGHEQVSFHMSGTEAVMQAVRLARYHTGRKRIVRFCGAYHGFWDDVQPGPGNPVAPRDTLTLAEMSERTLKVLARRRDIACVLVNPLQALHPNKPAPGDSSLVDSSRSAGFDRGEYARWLHKLRSVCNERGIVLIFDEVFLGFRLAPGGAQQYFGVRADLVTYGKTLGGGLPIGVVCGPARLMARFRDERPADICFARGTFNAHPYVMAAMNAFLRRLAEPQTQALYQDLDLTWNTRAQRLNERLQHDGLPVRVANMSTVFTITYTEPMRYNWLFQFYLRRAGLALSWVGSGRMIFSLNYTEDDWAEVAARFVAAAHAMRDDGFFHVQPGVDNRMIRRRLLLEMLRVRLGLEPWRAVAPAPQPGAEAMAGLNAGVRAASGR